MCVLVVVCGGGDDALSGTMWVVHIKVTSPFKSVYTSTLLLCVFLN